MMAGTHNFQEPAVVLDESSLRNLFQACDEDHNGRLSKSELLKAFNTWGRFLLLSFSSFMVFFSPSEQHTIGYHMTLTELDASFKVLDKNGDGELDFVRIPPICH